MRYGNNGQGLSCLEFVFVRFVMSNVCLFWESVIIPFFVCAVCDPATTDQMFASVTFFNLLKLQRSSYIECTQENLMDPVTIHLCNKVQWSLLASSCFHYADSSFTPLGSLHSKIKRSRIPPLPNSFKSD